MDLPGRTPNTLSKGGETPVTVFTGFVGVGKTTIILSLLESMPKGYKFCLLKNEFGDVKVDSQIAKLKNIDVQEMTNGCLCCVLVGQMKEGLLELKEKYNPDRIIIETSGSAFPGPIAWQVRELADEGFVLDSILNVVDCKNFNGYSDNSYTAQLQAKYTDLVLLTKHEGVSERDLDRVIDRVNDLNTDAPKVFVNVDQPVSPELIFGLDTKLFELQGAMAPNNKTFQDELDQHGNKNHHKNELDTMEIKCFGNRNSLTGNLDLQKFEKFLGTLDKDDVYRLKGFVRLSGILETGSEETTSAICVVNHAFGKWTITPVPEKQDMGPEDERTDSPAHDHDHCHDDHHHHNHPHASHHKANDQVLQMHFIIMGELWGIKHKLIYGCGAEYASGQALCEFKASSDVVEWDKSLPGTYSEFVAEQMASKQ
ncbi:CobW/HypB/UreG, nucleotide-binding domain-containing protein [Dissophora ornata]|nr:CobW/HypB/UreG, nucleotide-binding domain-containing protein [Dissophora ornata]